MSKPWIQYDQLNITLEVLPTLLDRYNLLPDLLRKIVETEATSNIQPSKEEQVLYLYYLELLLPYLDLYKQKK